MQASLCSFGLSKRFLFSLFILSAISFGCTKNDSDVRSREISFSAPSSYINGAETKTVYSGIESGGKEGINWVDDDLVRIYSDQASTPGGEHYADYVVRVESQASASDIRSKALIEPQGGRGTGLWWGSGTHNFYAVYPSPSTSGLSTGSIGVSGNSLEFTVPTTQSYTSSESSSGGIVLKPDMKYAYMWAGLQTAESPNISLSFRPLFTAFEFTIGSDEDDSMTFTSFSLSSGTKALSGSATGVIETDVSSGEKRISSYTYPTPTDDNKKVVVNFTGGVTVTKEKTVTFTVFTLPQSYDDLTASWTTSSGQVHSLKLKYSDGTFVEFEKERKYRIKSLKTPGDWVYSIGSLNSSYSYGSGGTVYLTESTFRSIRTKGGVEENVPYKFQWRESGSGAEWQDGLPDWITVKNASGKLITGTYTGVFSGERLSITFARQTADVVREEVHTNALKTGTPGGKSLNGGEVYDLSYYNVATGQNTTDQNTANCYVVKAPGTYRFPLVYGNAIKNGAINEKAYKQQSSATGTSTLNVFQNHLGNDITSPWINGSSGVAELLWQDVPGLITNVTVDGNFIKFTVPEETIEQGNALLALKIGGQIAWSWHIWVTDRSLTPNWNILPYYLGWTDAKTTTTYPKRSVYIRAVQDVPGGANTSATYAHQYETIIADYTAPIYYWGRKDPFPGVVPGNLGERYAYTKSATFYSATGTEVSFEYVNWTSSDISKTIKNPTVRYTYSEGSSGRALWVNPAYNNLWNTNTGATGESSNVAYKTIYDPSPVGYRIPTSSNLNNMLSSTFSFYQESNSAEFPNMSIFRSGSFILNCYAIGGSSWDHRSAVFMTSIISSNPPTNPGEQHMVVRGLWSHESNNYQRYLVHVQLTSIPAPVRVYIE